MGIKLNNKTGEIYADGNLIVPNATIKTDATAAPTANDDVTNGYGPGSVWIDVTNDKAYICVDGTDTAAVWVDVSQAGASDLDGLTDVVITTVASGEIVKYDGANWVNNTLAEAGIAAASHTHVKADITDSDWISNVVEDTTPQLGGNLDVQANAINTSTVNGNITVTPNGTGNVVLGNYTFDGDQTVGAGQDNYVLTYDNAAGTIGLEAAAGGGLANVVEDTTPQLGGQLDVNGNAIGDGTLELLKFSETASAVNELTITNAATGGAPSLSATGDDANVDLDLIAKGTGHVVADTNYLDVDHATANTQLRLLKAGVAKGRVYLGGANPDLYVDSNSGDLYLTNTGVTHKWPTADGTANQAIITDGSGNLSFADHPKSNFNAISAPTSTNDSTEGYEVGSIWIDVAVDNSYICVDATASAAVWKSSSGLLEIVQDGTPQLGGNLDYNGYKVADANGNEVLEFGSVTSAIHHFKITNGDGTPGIGGLPQISVTGTGTPGGLAVYPYTDQDMFYIHGNLGIHGTGHITDSNENEMISFYSVGTPVNQVQVENAATGNDVKLNAIGDDTNIGFNISTKGTGTFKTNGFEWAADGAGSNGSVLKSDGSSGANFSLTALGIDCEHTIEPDCNRAGAANAIAIGHNAKCGPTNAVSRSIAIGDSALCDYTSTGDVGHNSVAIGRSAKVYIKGGVAYGYNAQVGTSGTNDGIQGVALGINTDANGDYSVACGAGAQATADYAVALGGGTVSNAVANSVMLGTNYTGIHHIQDEVQTTDATQTTIATIAVPSGEERVFVAKVRGHESATNDFIWETMTFGVKNVSGTCSIVGSIDSVTGGDAGTSAWAIDASASGGNILIQVTGEAAHTIDWSSTVTLT